MLDYLRFRWELFGLQRTDRKSGRKNAAAIKAAKLRKSPKDEIGLLEYEGVMDGWHYQDEIRKLHSRYLSGQAARLLIPRPDLRDEIMWEKEGPNYIFLTEHGVNHMRAAIRAERKARLEMFLMWVPGIVGILGTLIGLVAILTGKK
jgi:hypothetical protein